MFSVRCLYTKHGNNKQEAYAIAFIDVDLGEKQIFSHRIFRSIEKTGFLFRGFNFANQRRKIFWRAYNFANEKTIHKILENFKVASKGVL